MYVATVTHAHHDAPLMRPIERQRPTTSSGQTRWQPCQLSLPPDLDGVHGRDFGRGLRALPSELRYRRGIGRQLRFRRRSCCIVDEVGSRPFPDRAWTWLRNSASNRKKVQLSVLEIEDRMSRRQFGDDGYCRAHPSSRFSDACSQSSTKRTAGHPLSPILVDWNSKSLQLLVGPPKSFSSYAATQTTWGGAWQ